MPDIDIAKSLEEERQRKEQQALRESVQETVAPADSSSSSDGKKIVIVVAVILGILVAFVGGFKVYDHFTSASVVSIDELHQQNLNGTLDDGDGYVYNGYSFIKADGLWWTETMRDDTLIKIPLHFGPKEVENITLDGALDPAFNVGEEVFVAIDPNVQNKYYTLSLSELIFNMAKGVNRIPVGSCTEENWACENRTIISCENNPENQPVVELAVADAARVELQGACIKISGNNYDLVRATDRVVYQWYGIME